jgi:putative tail protein
MAVLALFAVGAAVGGAAFGAGSIAASLVATAAATIGSVIDSQFTFPMIFGTGATQNGPRVTDLHPQTASEGAPMNFCLGPQNRVAGNIIWQQPQMKEHKHKVKSGKGGMMGGADSGGNTYTYTISLAIGICEGPIYGIMKIWADDKVIFDFNNGIAELRSDSVSFYLGTETQTADPVIQAQDGVAFTSAYRGTAYIVFENLKLEDFGNRIPNFTFMVAAHDQLPLKDAMSIMFNRAGLVAGQYDTSRVPGCLRGYNWQGPQQLSSNIIPVLNAYSLRTQESQGKLIVFPRGEEEIKVVSSSLLAAREFGESAQQILEITDTTGFKLPTEVDVNYIDPNLSNQKGSVGDRRQVAPTSGVMSVDVPFTINQSQALVIAKQTLWTLWSERQSAVFFLPPSCMGLQEADVVQVAYLGNTYQIRILELDRGANFILKVTGVIQEPESALMTASADDRTNTDPSATVYYAPILNGVIMDLPPLRTIDTNSAGYYRAVGAKNSTKWRGASLYWSDPSGASFVDVEDIRDEGSTGITLTALAADQGRGKWDDASTVDVLMFSGDLANETKLNVLGGVNTILIGREVLAYNTATLIAPNTYRLSGLIRGLRVTTLDERGYLEPAHYAGETVVVLDEIGFNVINSSLIGSSKAFRFVPVGEALTDVGSQVVPLFGNTLRPFPPGHVRGIHNYAAISVDVSWTPRTRDIVRIFGQASTTGSFTTDTLDGDHYEVKIWLDDTGLPDFVDNPARTFEMDGKNFTYTNAMMIADGLYSAGGAIPGPDHDGTDEALWYNVIYNLRFEVTQIAPSLRRSKTATGFVSQTFRRP